MSWDVALCPSINEDGYGTPYDDAEHFEGEGGTFALGGTTETALNVTYNYSEMWSVKLIRGLTGEQSIPLLQEQIERCGDSLPYKDYWAPTFGNLKAALVRLLKFAQQHPEGIWSVT